YSRSRDAELLRYSVYDSLWTLQDTVLDSHRDKEQNTTEGVAPQDKQGWICADAKFKALRMLSCSEIGTAYYDKEV
ncbi:hypothetical protein HPB47_023606, partial [Ixodes persulcatus]